MNLGSLHHLLLAIRSEAIASRNQITSASVSYPASICSSYLSYWLPLPYFIFVGAYLIKEGGGGALKETGINAYYIYIYILCLAHAH